MKTETVGLIGGTGSEGKGIAYRLAREGVSVTIGSRSEPRAKEAADEVNQNLGATRVIGAGNSELPGRCTLLFLTVPFQHAQNTLQDLAPQMDASHVLVDITVPLYFDKGPRLFDLDTNSGSEQLRDWLPPEVPVVAAFKTLPAHVLEDTQVELDCDEFICGSDRDAQKRVLAVAEKIQGIRWIDAGPLRYSRSLEAMTLLVIGINRRYKTKEGCFRIVGLPA